MVQVGSGMAGVIYLGLAGLIVLLVPVVVLPWEGRRVPDALFAAIVAGGLLLAGLQGGSSAVLRAGATGLGCLAVVTGIAIAIRKITNLQLFTSSHLKLLSAGAVWLGPGGALAMVCIAFAALFAIGILLHGRSHGQRPDFSAIAALAILCVGLQQAIPDEGAAAAAHAAKPLK